MRGCSPEHRNLSNQILYPLLQIATVLAMLTLIVLECFDHLLRGPKIALGIAQG